jgi:hypothetical protein
MIFTASDVASVSKSLGRWEIAEYIFEGLVIVACAGELIADLGRKYLTGARRDRIERWSTILLVAALSMELICLVQTNKLSGSVIGSLGDKAAEADRQAGTAIADSATALAKGNEATTTAGRSVDKSNEAGTAASGAQTLARNARKEVERLQTDLDKATAEAVALQKKLDDTAKAQWPRRLLNPKKFVEFLKGKPKAVVRILFTPNDSESYDFAYDLYTWLGPGNIFGAPGAGWDVSKPEPIPSEGGDQRPEYANAPPAIKWGAWSASGSLGSRSGLGLLGNESASLTEFIKHTDNTAFGALSSAFSDIENFSTAVHPYSAWVPKGTIIVVVGQKE